MLMDWRSLIESTLRAQSTDGYKISPIWHSPASDAAIANTEEILGIELPHDWKQVLTISDGVSIRMQWADHDVDTGHFLWPVQRIKKENLFFRTDSRLRNSGLPVGNLLFFADAGNGDSYGFIVSADGKSTGPIIIHEHETDEYWQFAISLEEFIQQPGTGKSNT